MDNIGIIGAVNESRFEFHIAPNPCSPQDSSLLEDILSTLRVVPRSLVPLVVRLNLHVRVETTLEVEFSTRSIWYSYHVEMDRRVLIYNESLTLKGRNCLDLGMCSHLGL